MRAFEHRHVVSFRETNLVGNVYFSHHLCWQGACREMFLREHAPDVLEAIADGLSLVTMSASCEYYDELRAFDEVLIRMYLKALGPNRVGMTFDYFRISGNDESLVARGRQEIASMQHGDAGLSPRPLPANLVRALETYAGAGE
ncbi:MAG: acyl-CoA thioesterase [Proteobacteria bacterium]|nr:acyl-CoA thioesterase [Pseudomonadota bacterium]